MKNLLKQIITAFAFIGFAFFAGFVIYTVFNKQVKNIPVLITQQIKSNQFELLEIPSIGVKANVDSVGVTKDGLMDSPTGPLNVGWFNLGPVPGDVGSAVVDGHSGWKGGTPAVFDNLYKIRIGDKIYTKTKDGTVVTFVVRELRTYGKDDNALGVFFSNDGRAHLNLITCSGSWNELEKTHSDRLVVFADKE